MQETPSKQDYDDVEDIQFDSFFEVEEDLVDDVKHGETGFARLIDCEYVEKSEIPEDYREQYVNLADSYIVFDAKLGKSDKTVKVVCPARDNGVNIQMALDMAGVSEISKLAGKEVPIQHVENNVYRICLFNSDSNNVNLQSVPISIVRKMIDTGVIKFEGGRWKSNIIIPPIVVYHAFFIFAIYFSALIGTMLFPAFTPILPITIMFVWFASWMVFNRRN